MVLVFLCPSAALQNNNYNCVESTTLKKNHGFFFLKLSRTTILRVSYKLKPAKSHLKRGMVRGQEVGHLQGNVKCDVSDMNWSEKVSIR